MSIQDEIWSRFKIDREIEVEWKSWGCRQFLGDTHICYIIAGGYSSTHFHQAHDNWFLIVSGLLEIKVEDSIAVYMAGDSTLVAHEALHSFRAIMDTILLERYVSKPITDIVRESLGGIKYEKIT